MAPQLLRLLVRSLSHTQTNVKFLFFIYKNFSLIAYISWRCGIDVFATGGIGGVHRDGHVTMDVSADLTTLAQVNMAVVCAGAKSILDLPRTLEYLETMGVNVVGYQTKEFPSFFTRTSGLPLQCCVDTPQELAQILCAWSFSILSF